MGKKSAPAAPDYQGLAQQQAGNQQELLAQQTWANRANQTNPYGSQTWGTQTVIDPSTGQPVTQWTQNTTYSPAMQATMDAQLALSRGRNEAGLAMGKNLMNTLGQPIDTSGFSAFGRAPGGFGDYRQQAEDAIYKSATSRLDPQWAQRQSDLETQLANRGITRGSAAFDREMGNLNSARTDAYQQAQNNAFTGAGAEAQRAYGMDLQSGQFANSVRAQQLQEAMGLRGQGINELNSVLQGSQVQGPSFGNYTQAGMGQAADLLGAAGSQYGANLDAFNAKQAGTAGTIGAIGTAAAAFF